MSIQRARAALPVLFAGGYTYLLRDEFTTTESAPLTSPRTAEPGPGTLTLVQTDGQFSISAGKLQIPAQTTPAWGNLGFYAGGQSRATGRALLATINLSTWEEVGVGWHTAAAVADPDGFAHALQANTTDGRLDIDGGASVATGLSLSTDYSLAFVLRTAGAHYLYNNGSTWQLLWVDGADTTATVYPAFASLDAVGTLDAFRVADLGAPFDDDYGIATDRIIGAASNGELYTHTADALIEGVVTTVPPASILDLKFRLQDASNFWTARTKPSGDIDLVEVVAGGTSVRGSSAAAVSNGSRIVITAVGETIKVYVDNVLKITYSSAANFKTVTTGKLEWGAGAISDIIAWPRTLSGSAASALNKL